MAGLNPPDQRFYAAVAIPYDPAAIIPTNTDAVAFNQLVTNNEDPLLRSAPQTGTRAMRTGASGRDSRGGDVAVPMSGGGADGTAADMEALLADAFGQAGTVVATTAVTYNLADANPALSLWSYRDPSSVETWDEVCHGAVVETLAVTSSEELATVEMSGIGTYVADKPNFSSLDPDAQGGLASFRSEERRVGKEGRSRWWP